jgi:hypothetical protein
MTNVISVGGAESSRMTLNSDSEIQSTSTLSTGRSDLDIAVGDIILTMMLLVQKIYNAMKGNQARNEEAIWALQLKQYEKAQTGADGNLAASDARATGQMWSAILMAAFGVVGIAGGAKAAGTSGAIAGAASGLQMVSQLSGAIDNGASSVSEFKAGDHTKFAEEARAALDILKGHVDSAMRSSADYHDEADKVRSAAQSVYETLQRLLNQLETMKAMGGQS